MTFKDYYALHAKTPEHLRQLLGQGVQMRRSAVSQGLRKVQGLQEKVFFNLRCVI